MRRAYIDIPQGQVHYRIGGSGEPVLFLHQTAFSSEEFSEVMPVVARSCQVIGMDTVGYGMSDSPPRAFQIEDYGRTVRDFLAALDIKKASVVGHHTGSSIGLEVAASYPELVDKLILSGVPYYTEEEREERLSGKKYPERKMTEDGSFLMQGWEMMRRFMSSASVEARVKMMAAGFMAGPRAEEAHHAVFRYDEKRRLPLVKSPALLIYGTLDTFYHHREETHRMVPRSRIKLIEGAGPLIALEQPEAFARAILEFLRDPGV